MFFSALHSPPEMRDYIIIFEIQPSVHYGYVGVLLLGQGCTVQYVLNNTPKLTKKLISTPLSVSSVLFSDCDLTCKKPQLCDKARMMAGAHVHLPKQGLRTKANFFKLFCSQTEAFMNRGIIVFVFYSNHTTLISRAAYLDTLRCNLQNNHIIAFHTLTKVSINLFSHKTQINHCILFRKNM